MSGTYRLNMTIFCGSAIDADNTAKMFNKKIGIDASPYVAQVRVVQSDSFEEIRKTIDCAAEYGELEFLVKQSSF